MKVVAQRVKHAKVEVEKQVTGEIKKGLLLYVCFEQEDSLTQVQEAAQKVSKLRIFEDEKGKMNLNLSQAGGAILSISQFTLSWDGKKGHRPSFDRSMPPTQAKSMYEIFNKNLMELGLKVETGIFGADMQVYSVNDGPVTFHLPF